MADDDGDHLTLDPVDFIITLVITPGHHSHSLRSEECHQHQQHHRYPQRALSIFVTLACLF